MTHETICSKTQKPFSNTGVHSRSVIGFLPRLVVGRNRHLTIYVLFLLSLTLSSFYVWQITPGFAQSETCDLEYVVDMRVPQNHVAFVSMAISLQSNIASFILSINDWWHYKDQRVQILYVASKKENQSLTFNMRSSSSWIAYPTGYTELVVKYAVTLLVPYFNRIGYFSYLGSEFGVAYEYDVLLKPSLSLRNIRTIFSLPSGWVLVSPYELQSDGSYSPGAIGLWNCIIGVGPFRVDNYLHGSYQLSVASYGQTRYAPEKYGESIQKFVQYFTRFSDGFWSKRLVVIVAPQPMKGGGYAQGPALFVRGDVDWRVISHELIHVWNTARRASDRESWWNEGVTDYYAGLALVYASIWSESDYSNWIVTDSYRTYAGYLGTSYDIALSEMWTSYQNSGDQGYYRNLYGKGALVAFLLDRIVQHITVNRTLSDVVKYLNGHFTQNAYTNIDLIAALASVTSASSSIRFDFTEFFNNYVYGTKRLPLSAREGRLIVDWPELLRTQLKDLGAGVFNASRNTVSFVRTGNIYDDSALGFFYSKCVNPQNIIPVTDLTKINQTSGTPLFAGNLVTFGGRAANKVTKYYEDQGLAAISFLMNSTHYVLMKGSTVVYAVRISAYNYTREDYFVMHAFRDGVRLVFLIWGISHTGTYASGIYFADVVYPNLASYTQGYYIFKWTDLDGNGIQTSNEVMVVAGGS